MSQPGTTERHVGRSVTAAVLFIVATLLLIPAVVGHWGNRTVIDTDRYVDTVTPLIQQPEVQAALATAVTDQITARLDTESQVEKLLGNILPGDSGLSGILSAPIASGINGLITNLVTKFVASEQFAQVWVAFNRAAQQSAVKMLEGSNDGIVQLQGDDLVIDISVALQSIQTYLVDSGISAAANIPLPSSARYVTVAHTPVLAQARSIYQVAGPVLSFLPILVALLFALAIILSRYRARTVVAMGVVLIGGMIVLLVGVDAGQQEVARQLALTPWAAAVNAFWWTLLDYLVAGAQGFIALGVVFILAGWFGGRTKAALWARGHVIRGLSDLSGRTPSGESALLPARSLPWLRGAAYVIGLGLLVLSGTFSVSTVLWTSALVAGLITVIQIFGGPAKAAPALPAAPVAPESPALI